MAFLPTEIWNEVMEVLADEPTVIQVFENGPISDADNKPWLQKGCEDKNSIPSHQALYNLCLVSKQMYNIARVHLYTHLKIEEDWPRDKNLLLRQLHAEPGLAQSVKSLLFTEPIDCFCDGEDITQIPEGHSEMLAKILAFTNASELFTTEIMRHVPGCTLSQLGLFLLICPNVENLMAEVSAKTDSFRSFCNVLHRVSTEVSSTSFLSSIRRVRLLGVGYDAPDLTFPQDCHLAHQWPNLRYLHLDSPRQVPPMFWESMPRTIEILRLSGWFSENGMAITDLIFHCPRLKHLYVSSSCMQWCHWNFTLFNSSLLFCEALETLHISDSTPEPRGCLAPLSGFRSLKSVRVPLMVLLGTGANFHGQISFGVVVRFDGTIFPRNIEHIHIDTGEYYNADSITNLNNWIKFARRCNERYPLLKSFYVSGYEEDNDPNVVGIPRTGHEFRALFDAFGSAGVEFKEWIGKFSD